MPSHGTWLGSHRSLQWQPEIENRTEKKKREEAEKLVSQTLNNLISKEQSGGTCEKGNKKNIGLYPNLPFMAGKNTLRLIR